MKQINFICEVGKGSFGVVYKATWNNTEVAVKQLIDQNLQSADLKAFEAEAVLMLSIGHHPNVVNFYGVCTDPLCVVTEFVANGCLNDQLQKLKTSLRPKYLSFFKDIIQGLSYLHSQKIIHRDLATRNVLLTIDWRCKLADFGLSRQGGQYQKETKSNVGPLKWMAPEAIAQSKYSVATDIYSMGVTFSEVLNEGEEPYPGLMPITVAVEVISKGIRPSVPDWTPQSLTDLIWATYQTDPNQRPPLAQIYDQICYIEQTDWQSVI